MTNKEGLRDVLKIFWIYFFVWPLEKKMRILLQMQAEYEEQFENGK